MDVAIPNKYIIIMNKMLLNALYKNHELNKIVQHMLSTFACLSVVL